MQRYILKNKDRAILSFVAKIVSDDFNEKASEKTLALNNKKVLVLNKKANEKTPISSENESENKNEKTPILNKNDKENKIEKTLILSEIKLIEPEFLPLNINANELESSLTKWLKRRRVPENRIYARRILATLPKKDIANNFMDYIDVGLGLSLNDSLWIVPENSDFKWADFSLHANDFDENLRKAASGYKMEQITGVVKSPELTTDGMLPKFWRKKDGKIELIKGSSGFYECNEAFSEHYMSQVAEILGFECVKYDLVGDESSTYSLCECFTSEKEGFLPIHFFLDKKERKLKGTELAEAVCRVFEREKFEDLMLFDALICNIDRHLGNFGLIIDNDSGAILRPAPIFDNGLSALSRFQKYDIWGSISNRSQVFGCQTGFFQLRFDMQLEFFARKRHLKALERLAQFSFKEHRIQIRSNDYENRLSFMQDFLKYRAEQAIKYLKKR